MFFWQQEFGIGKSLGHHYQQDLRIAQDIWRKLAESEAQPHLIVELGYLEVGFPDIENFCLE
jgi:hypothetical protein